MGNLAATFPSPYLRGLIVICLLIVACALRARGLRFGNDIVEGVDEVLASDSREIGAAVKHSSRVIMLTEAYCGPLQFYGDIAGMCWPYADVMASQGLTADELLAEAAESNDFFVVTYAYEIGRQSDLREELAAYPEVLRSDRYIIYDLRTGE
jgi:hypothetical protein